MPFPDMENALCDALTAVTTRTGTPAPKRDVEPPEIRLLRVPGAPPGTPWQDIVQVEITHYGASRAQAWELARETETLLQALNPNGGRVGGAFVDYALKVADGVMTVDQNPDVRPVVAVWRFAVRDQ
jgi:hypothetical protein